MRPFSKCFLVSLVLLFAYICPAYSQMKTTVEDIVNNPGNYENSEVIVEGIVTQYTEGRGTTNYYLLKGNFGAIIKCNTAQPEPKINAKYRVTGIVYRDRSSKEPFISEQSKELLLDKGNLVVTTTPEDAIVKLNGQVLSGNGPWELNVGSYNLEISKEGFEAQKIPVSIIADQITSETIELKEIDDPLLLYIIIAVIVVLVIFLIFSLSRRKKDSGYDKVSPAGSGKSTAEYKVEPPVFTTEQDYKTIRITKSSPPKTLKFIPGKLVITDGADKGKELKMAGYSTPEGNIITIGRKEVTGEKAYAHIHLNENTVSREQAEIIHRDGKVFIKNVSQTNFTQLDGQELTPGQMKELKPGSTVRAGEVEFKYQI